MVCFYECSWFALYNLVRWARRWVPELTKMLPLALSCRARLTPIHSSSLSPWHVFPHDSLGLFPGRQWEKFLQTSSHRQGGCLWLLRFSLHLCFMCVGCLPSLKYFIVCTADMALRQFYSNEWEEIDYSRAQGHWILRLISILIFGC